MERPVIIEVYADNGEFSHWALVSRENGEKLWSENPAECKAMGYPVAKGQYTEEDMRFCWIYGRNTRMASFDCLVSEWDRLQREWQMINHHGQNVLEHVPDKGLKGKHP